MELYARVGGPFDSIHIEGGAQQPICGGNIVLRWHAQRHQERVGEEDQLAVRTQQARGLGNPALRICPQGGAILRNREVEARIRVGDRLGVTMDELEIETMLALEAPRGGELR